MAGVAKDLKEGLRRLRRRPGFTFVAVGTLALGLSVSTAVFTYVNAYNRTFPGAQVEGLSQVWQADEGEPWGAVSVPDFRDLVGLNAPQFSVTGVVASVFFASVRLDQLAEVAVGEAVAGGFFSVLGVEMSEGRGLDPDDDRPGATPVTVISHDYWVSRYSADPAVVGGTILLNNEPYTIVGVATPEFRGSSAATRPQFWLPIEQFLRVYRPGPGTRENRNAGAIRPILALAPDASQTAAEEVLTSLARGLDTEAPLAEGTRRFTVTPATWISPETRAAETSTTTILMAAAGFLLVLACANVANLMLSAGAHRRSEMAIRRAMGASGGRLVRQLLTESLLLSVPAGLVALALAGPLSRRLSSYFARPSVWGANVPRDITVEPAVLAFALVAAVITGVLSGVVPALRTSDRSPAEALGSHGAGARVGRARGVSLPGVRDVLVAAQVGICVVLLFVAALVLRTLESASSVDPGFDTSQTLASYVSTSSMGVPIPERHRFFEELILRFEALPWVEAATVSENAPLSAHPNQELFADDGQDAIPTTVARVWPGFFEAVEMPLVQGRSILPTDTVDAEGVVVINESLAARLSPNGNAVGQSVTWRGAEGEPDVLYEVVGVAADAGQVALLEAPGPVIYFSLPQQYSRPGNALLLKVRGDPVAAVQRMEQELRTVDTRLAIVNILPYRAVVRGALYIQRMNAELFAAIAALALLLSVAGVFAVLDRAVASRSREIGIRMAMGGDWMAIATSVLKPIGLAVCVGLGLGLLGAYGATKLVGSLLWGVTPSDPLALGLGVSVLLVAILPAIAVPLARAMKVDPADSLRAE